MKTPFAKKEAAEKQEAAQEQPLTALDRSQDAGRGSEHATQKDLKIPLLQIVQALSPERKKGHTKYIEGAEEGDIFNSVTRKLYKVNGPEGEAKKILIAPITHVRVHNEWVKRSLNGGYVKTYPDTGVKLPETRDGIDGQKKVRELVSDPTHCLVETVMHDVNVLDEDGTYEAIISMSGSNLGPSRDFTSKLMARKEKRGDGSQYTPAYFDNVVALGTAIKKFPDGECYVFTTEIVGKTSDLQFTDSKTLHVHAQERLALMAPAAAEAEVLPSPDNKY